MEPILRVLYPSHNDAIVSPGHLSLMAEAARSVASGVLPSEANGDVRIFDFGAVGIYLFPPRP
jgi:hypothetical protein